MFTVRSPQKHFGFKVPRFFLLSTFFVFVLTIPTYNCQADEVSEWLGVFRDADTGIIKVDMSIGKDNQYSMHYGVPRSCRMDLEELLETEKEILLKVKETSGGFCDDKYQADITITKDSTSAWTATIKKIDIDFTESYQLLKR